MKFKPGPHRDDLKGRIRQATETTVGPGHDPFSSDVSVAPRWLPRVEVGDRSLSSESLVGLDFWITSEWGRFGLPLAWFSVAGFAAADNHFDSDGRLLYSSLRNHDGIVDGQVVYLYDDNGWLVCVRQDVGLTTQPAELAKMSFSYDGPNRVTRFLEGVGGLLNTKTEFEYNPHGHEVYSKVEGEEPVRTTYEYDSKGNWIKKTVNGRYAVVEHTRTIEYIED